MMDNYDQFGHDQETDLALKMFHERLPAQCGVGDMELEALDSGPPSEVSVDFRQFV